MGTLRLALSSGLIALGGAQSGCVSDLDDSQMGADSGSNRGGHRRTIVRDVLLL
jgi:hypothetical protein